MKRLFTFLLTFFFFATAMAQSTIDPALQEVLSQAGDELIEINILLKSQVDQTMLGNATSHIRGNKKAKREFVVAELKKHSEKTQKELLSVLNEEQRGNKVTDIRMLWIVNVINCKASRDVILQLASHPDVAMIGHNKREYMLWNEEPTMVDIEKLSRATITSNVTQVNADDVWDLGYTGEGVVVAVIDSGVNYNHDDLKDHLWDGGDEYPNHGYDFVNQDNDPIDDHGHGTHCAGTICGDGNSGTYITGMAPDVTLMCLKTLNLNGEGSGYDNVDAMQFAVGNGADIVSMSLGVSFPDISSSAIYRLACVNTLNAGVIAAVAAGNDGDLLHDYPIPRNINAPGNCPPPWINPDQAINSGGLSCVVCVGAVNSNDEVAYFSSVGPVTWQDNTYAWYYEGEADYAYTQGSSTEIGLIRPDISAPGVSIISAAYDDNSWYMNMSGTSMATPCVAGVMALMLQKDPELEPADICRILEITAKPLSETKSNYTGAGRVDALAAINEINSDAYTFIGNGSWNTPSNWKGLDGNTLTYMPDFSNQNVIINGTAVIGDGIDAEVANITIKNGKSLTIQDGGTFTVNETATNSNFDGLILEEGAQVFVNNEGVAATFKKSVANPDVWETDHNKGWQFISSPLKNADIANFIPSNGDYDLFKYDGTQELQWQNHKDYGSGVLSDVTYTFDTGFDGWTTIDGDGDGYTFFHTDDVYSLTGYYLTDYGFSKEGIIFNSMYLEWKSDNYLVAPTKIKVFDGATISFDCYTTIFSGEPEQIGVAISTTGNTSSSDFTSIANYTFSTDAKYTVDLSEYAGEDVWIAIHHNTQSPSSGYSLFPMIDEIIITNSSHDFEETFLQGRGYLASYEAETTANMQGYLSIESSFNFPLTYNANDRWANFHLLGNPFTFDINWNEFAFSNVVDGIARMTTDGSYKYDVNSDIKVGEGFMIMTKGKNPSLKYGERSYRESYDNINIIATGSEGSDNMMVYFNGEENDGFPKLDNLNENISTVFVQRNNNCYGIASYDTDVTEIPFYFDAKEMGQYRIAIETETKFDNIYLYDRKSGVTVDMLAEKEYSFISEADENPDRFVLKLSDTNNETISDNFVYQSGEDLYVNAEGTIQIVDMMGRVIYSNDVQGNNNVINISDLNKAAYIVRNINENQVRIQKIVIL